MSEIEMFIVGIETPYLVTLLAASPLLYVLIRIALTIYWNRYNDGLINMTIIFGWLLWLPFLCLFTYEFIMERRGKEGEKWKQ